MATLIANNLNNLISFQDDTGIISYRTDGFFTRGCTNPTTTGIRYLTWDTTSTSYYVSSQFQTVGSSGFAPSWSGTFLVNFSVFFTGPATLTLDYNGTSFSPGSGTKKMVVAESRSGYNNLRGSCITVLDAVSPIRLYTSDTNIIGTLPQYAMFSAFRIA